MKVPNTIEKYGGELIPGYEFEAILLPGNEGFNDGDWDCDEKSIDVPYSNGHLWLRVTICGSKDRVAWATFGCGSTTVQCDTIEVLDDFRRKGIASQLYQIAACAFSAPVIPTGKQSPLANLFWKNRSSITC